MNQIRKTLCLLMALLMVLSCSPLSAVAHAQETSTAAQEEPAQQEPAQQESQIVALPGQGEPKPAGESDPQQPQQPAQGEQGEAAKEQPAGAPAAQPTELTTTEGDATEPTELTTTEGDATEPTELTTTEGDATEPTELTTTEGNAPAAEPTELTATEGDEPAAEPTDLGETSDILNETEQRTITVTVNWAGDEPVDHSSRPGSVQVLVESSTDGTNWTTVNTVSVPKPNPDTGNVWTLDCSLPTEDEAGNPLTYRFTELTSGLVDPTNNLARYFVTAPVVVGPTDTSASFTNTYNDAWDYSINLYWDSSTEGGRQAVNTTTIDRSNDTVVYKLDIATNKPYEAIDPNISDAELLNCDHGLVVRVPLHLMQDRDGNNIDPSRFSISSDSSINTNFNFTYRIIGDEVVFYNWQPLVATYNISMSVEYKINPVETADCSTGELHAEATGHYPNQPASDDGRQSTNPITYRIDTGAKIKGFEKSNGYHIRWAADPIADLDITTDTDGDNVPDHFYVSYKIKAEVGGNQPATIDLSDTLTASEDGKILKVIKAEDGSADYPNGTVVNNAVISADKQTADWSFTYTNEGATQTEYYYVIVDYPPSDDTYVSGEPNYHNNATAELKVNDPQHPDDVRPDPDNGVEGNDKNDTDSASDAGTALFEGLTSWHFEGEPYSFTKTFKQQTSAGSRFIENLEFGRADSTDIKFASEIDLTVNGYDYTDQGKGYSFEIRDDGFYARAQDGDSFTDYVRLTSEDFTPATVAVYRLGIVIDSSKVDRQTGQTIGGQVPTEPFILYGKKDDGSWVQVSSFRLDANGHYSSGYGYFNIENQGYCGWKLVSPNGLEDKYVVHIWYGMSYKGTSPAFRNWLETCNSVDKLQFVNLARCDIYKEQDDGSYAWANPKSSYTGPRSGNNFYSGPITGLADGEITDGQYHHYAGGAATIGRMELDSGMSKFTSSTINNIDKNTVSVQWKLTGYEKCPTARLSPEFYQEWSNESGVFYDLLPKGYYLDRTKPINVSGMTNLYAINYGGTYTGLPGFMPAALESVETIDNYKDTGRQMVIFRIRSTMDPGKNYHLDSTTVTGFGVMFWTEVGYADVDREQAVRNIAAYQRGDHAPMAKANDERGYAYGYYSDSYSNYLWDGTYPLRDPDGDGVASRETTTRYANSTVKPNILETSQNGLFKYIKGNSAAWTNKDITDLEGTYQYKLRLETNASGTTKDVIIYDVLENAANTGTNTGEVDGWKGVLQSVDASSATAFGIAPKVYYTTANVSYNDQPVGSVDWDQSLVQNPGIWSDTMPADPSTVTAVAIDLRYKEDGTPFEFDTSRVVEVIMTMEAPDKLQPSIWAYNRPAITQTLIPEGMTNASQKFEIGSRVQISLRDLQDLEFFKYYETIDADGNPIKTGVPGATFQLYQCTNTDEGHVHTGMPGTSDSCWELFRTAISTYGGIVSFTDLDTGEYAVIESAIPNRPVGLQKLDNRWWTFSVNALQGSDDPTKGSISNPVAHSTNEENYPTRDMVWDGTRGMFTLKDDLPSFSVNVEKSWEGPVQSGTLTFDLYIGDSTTVYQTKTVTIPAGQTSPWTITNLFTGLARVNTNGDQITYRLVERSNKGYTVTTPTDGSVTFEAPETGDYSTSFTNSRLGQLELEKIVAEGDETKEFNFTLTLTGGTPEQNSATYHYEKFAADDSNRTNPSEGSAAAANGVITVGMKHGEMIRFYDLPAGTTWTLAETATDGYSVEVTGSNGVTVNGTSGTATTTNNTTPHATFTNTCLDGDLKISKSITSGSADTSFTVKVTLEKGTETINGSFNAVVTAGTSERSETVSFTNGVATFSIKPNETWLIQALPAGATYTVEETGLGGGWTWVTADSTSLTGTISYGTTPEAVLVNSYEAKPVSVQLEGRKSFTGWPEGVTPKPTFTYTLKEGSTTLQTKTTVGEGAIQFDSITYNEAGTHTYTVQETKGNAPGVTYDPKTYTVTVTVTDDGSGQLKAAISGDSSTGKDLNFTNSYEAKPVTAQFKGNKTFTGWPTDVTPAPTFTYTLSENGTVLQTKTTQGAGAYQFDTISYTEVGTHTYTVAETAGSAAGVTYATNSYTITVNVTDDGSGQLKTTVTGEAEALDFVNTYTALPTSVQFEGMKTLTGKQLQNAEFSFTLTGSDGTDQTVTNDGTGKISFREIRYTKAGTYTYSVKEEATSEAGVTIDSKVYSLTVTVTDDGSGQLKATVSGDSTTGKDLSFANTYKAGSTSVNFGGHKSFTGWPADVTPAPTFTYTLSENGSVIDTKTTQGAGPYNFRSITYDTVGTHTYTVVEAVSTPAPGVTYDPKTYEIQVEVTDDGSGQLKTTITGAPETLNFTNTYKAKPVSVTFEGMKTLTGKQLKDAEFSFTLTGPNADQTVKNNGQGKISFSPIEFTAVGTYEYTVRENATQESGVTIDSKVYSLTVTVTDDGSGQLAAAITGDSTTGKDLNFKNIYKAGSTSVNFGGQKSFTGWPTDVTPAPTFTYTLSEGETVLQTASTQGAGAIAFDSITYDKVGTHTYTVVEAVSTPAPGVTYDPKTYEVTVEVTDDGSGTLKTKVTGTPEALNFTNTYKAKPVTVQFEGMKTLTGKQLQDAEFSFTLTGSDGTDQTVTNNGQGKISFAPIKYETTGTYTYTVVENATDEEGVTIDSTRYNITVEVTDEGDGQLKATITGANPKGLDFHNEYKAGSTSVNFGGQKTLTGWPEGVTPPVFTFTLKEGETVLDTQTTNGSGKITFKSISYDAVGTHTYTVQESAGNAKGMTYDTKTYTVTVEVYDDGLGKLKTNITGTPEALDFTNTYQAEPTSVHFEGLKTLEGKQLKNAEFSFTLTGSDGTDQTKTNDGQGKIVFDDITYNKAGTYTYTVKEKATQESGVTIDSTTYNITVKVTDDGSGQLTAEVTGADPKGLNFKNTYKAGSTSITLGGTKSFSGWPEGVTPPVFTYTLSENGSVIDTKTTNGPGAYQFNSITYDKVGTHTYTVAETKGSAKGVTYDTRTYTVVVEVTDDGSGKLKTNITGTPDALDFVNSYKAKPVSVQFEGLKTLTGKALKDAEFSFTLTGSGNVNETVTNDGDGKISFSEIKYEKAGTYTYTVKEEATNEGGVTIDSTVYNITVTVTDDGSGQLAAEVTGADPKALNFENTYVAGSTSVDFGGTKTFTGYPEGATPPTFTYTMSENGSVIDTQTTRGAGEYKFKSISYDTVGTHTYTVVETKGSAKGVTYDTKTYTVTVEVYDDGLGLLKTNITGTPKELDFTNTYKAEPVSVQFEGLKTLEGKDLQDAEFSFTLTGSGDVNETVKNDGEGKISFTEITYDKAGTYTYTVKEEASTERGVTIDSTVYNITVEVTDSGNGQLAAEVTGADPKALNFKNTYKADSTSVNFGGTKTFTGYPEDATPPTFTYTMSENGSVIDTKTTKGAGEYKFESITYDEVGTHTYTVVEISGNAKGVTYDTKTYTVTVEVYDDGLGLLKTNITGDDPAALDFTNSYKPEPVSVQFEGLKTLEGRELKDAEFSFTLTGSGNVDVTVKNDGEGKITFPALSFVSVGTYTYTIKEEAKEELGIVIDSTVYELTVEVTDDGSGQLATEVTGADPKQINFVNQYLNGNLTITKMVTGQLGDKNKAFTFTIKLGCEGEFEYDGDVTGTISDGGTIRLKHGQSVTIKGLPAGCEYTVTESGNTGYRVYSTGAVGVIEDKATAIAAFTNSKSRVPATGESNWMLAGLAMMASSSVGMFGIARAKKRKEDEDQVR